MNPHDIARQIDKSSINDLNILISKDDGSIIQSSLYAEHVLKQFIGGNTPIAMLKTVFEQLANVADHTLNVISIAFNKQNNESSDLQVGEIVIDESSQVDTAYELVDTIKSWLRGNYNSDDLMTKASNWNTICRNLYRNISILETHVANDFIVEINDSNTTTTPISKFNRILIESLSTGAIAIRPIALKNTEQPRRKKRKWFLQYTSN